LSRVVWIYLPVVLLSHRAFADLFDSGAVRNWATIFLSVTLQALPFLVLGVLVSAALSALVPPTWLARISPTRPLAAVPVAGLAGALLPGCECSSVPVAGRLVERGVPPSAALTFLLAAPAINPVVIVSTAVAFRGDASMVGARFLASLLTAVTVGALWSRRQDIGDLRSLVPAHEHGTKLDAFTTTASTDFVQAGGFLVLGATIVATLQTVVPSNVLDAVGGSGIAAVAAMAVLAVVLSICSEADAFVAVSLPQFSLTARLVFLVVGPVVDIKLIALQAGTFGRPFASRFAPLTFVVAVASALLVGSVLL
jgi:uncharacterized membrane protein YraQ (UPF0718 family)